MQELILLFSLHKFIQMRSGVFSELKPERGMTEDYRFGFNNPLRGYQLKQRHMV
jgi:hypothetical protein